FHVTGVQTCALPIFKRLLRKTINCLLLEAPKMQVMPCPEDTSAKKVRSFIHLLINLIFVPIPNSKLLTESFALEKTCNILIPKASVWVLTPIPQVDIWVMKV